MKINYFTYYWNDSNNNKILYNLTNLLDIYLTKSTLHCKQSIINQRGETQYIVKVSNKGYMFITTKNKDIAKVIEAVQQQQNIQSSALSNLLSTNQELGFASYVSINNEKCFSYASALYGAFPNHFIDFLNRICEGLSLGASVTYEPILRSVTFPEMMQFERIASFKALFPTSFNFGQLLLSSSPDVSHMEVTVKPKTGKDIRDVFADFYQHYGSQATALVVKAKEDVTSRLADYCLTVGGAAFDIVAHDSDFAILMNMEQMYNGNTFVVGKVNAIQTNNFAGSSQTLHNNMCNATWPYSF